MGYFLHEAFRVYHQCISLLRNQDESTYYCVIFKMWNEPCPKKCAYKAIGKIGTLEEVKVNGYDIECIFMKRAIKNNQLNFYCSLYQMPDPFCKECQFPQYTAGPIAEMDLSEQ